MTSETRYMRSDRGTVNGLEAYKLLTTQTTSYLYSTPLESIVCSFQWGIRVFKLSEDGSETEITSGVPVAVVTKTTVTEQILSATWVCPETDLVSTDAILVRVYCRVADGFWYLCYVLGVDPCAFLTEQLGAVSLSLATWTVYYTCYVSYRPAIKVYYAFFGFGDSTRNSRIENFTWTSVVVAKKPVGDGLTFAV